MAKRLLSGRWVMLSYKETERRDRYDRILAYMYRVPDGLFINREMIRLGCAKAYSFNGHPYKEDFARIENEARSAELGLWNPRPVNTPPNHTNGKKQTMAKVPYKTTIRGLDGKHINIEQSSEDDDALIVEIDDTHGNSMGTILSKKSVLRLFADFANDVADEVW